MFIVIEGLDGVGKSTITKALATAIDAVVLTTPGDNFKGIRDQLEVIYQDNHQARQLFYMSTVVSISEQVRDLISKGKNVIVDRYWLSTQVYHHWKSDNSHFELLDVEKTLLVPDITLYLELSLEQRKKRLSGRTVNTVEDNLTLTETVDTELNNLYDQYSNASITGRWLHVDANATIADIVKTICNKLQEFEQG
ncbi:Thymidylate kinase-dTMP kinase [Moritella viscosa]|uniref:dTMP kinase n=1 Tax=Moritella viscosa TaxID=80854 RepID=UPI0005091C3A|nr:deoxynucleoside kinase [Moritella viscosa]CED59517.1 putative thymidylate kinase [Moritella viscosa]SHO01982.1 Thymidylate kinase-dTMP kinase [Moritella viscosa]SHO20633.1 Thymidylate kinase-dTMP kinase [Moritella viscosa]